MPQFSIKDLLWATLLIALGICLLVSQFRIAPADSVLWVIGFPGCFVLLVCGFGAVFAGLFTPFHRTKLGFKIGAGLAIVLLVILLAMLPRVH